LRWESGEELTGKKKHRWIIEEIRRICPIYSSQGRKYWGGEPP